MAMGGRGVSSLIVGLIAGLLLTGLPYWRLPYSADFLADTPVRIGFAGLALIAALLAATGAARPGRIVKLMLIPYPLAVALRVAVEVAADPTSHNLWPFELVFAVLLSALLVVPGVVVGTLVRRVRG